MSPCHFYLSILVIFPRPCYLFFPRVSPPSFCFIIFCYCSPNYLKLCPAPGFWALLSDTLLLSVYSDLVPSYFAVPSSSRSLLCDSFLFLASVVFSLYSSVCPISDTRLMFFVLCLHSLFFATLFLFLIRTSYLQYSTTFRTPGL
jgi:hypothetical protein